jgi:hypothetical protein
MIGTDLPFRPLNEPGCPISRSFFARCGKCNRSRPETLQAVLSPSGLRPTGEGHGFTLK